MTLRKRIYVLLVLILGGLGLAAEPAQATGQSRADLVIAQQAAATSLDPHALNYGPNLMMAANVFDRLIHQDAQQRLVPGLALAWRAIDPLTWEFDLRPGVTFHDGSAFDAADVVASMRRAARVTGYSALSFFAQDIAKVEAAGPLRVRITTRTPDPLLPNVANQIGIIPSRLEDAPSEAFEDGSAMIGTGPFRFVEWTPGAMVRLARNPAWWGGASPWETVELRAIADDATRIAALIGGDVDMIDNVPPADVARLVENPRINVAATTTSRIIYVGFEVGEAVPPDTFGPNGEALTTNPFRDRRVRRAISMAVNRDALVHGSMDGQATAAAQAVLPGLLGAAPDLDPPPFDPAGAMDLLAEAGYPDGFRTTLSCPRGRYVNDVQVCNAVALMLNGVGIQTATAFYPGGTFYKHAAAGEFALRLAGWGTGSGEAAYTLRGLLVTRDIEAGTGVSNYGHYSNPRLDAMVADAVKIFDDAEREAHLAAASRYAAADIGLVPLYFQKAVWATRSHILYLPLNDEFTLPIHVKPTVGN